MKMNYVTHDFYCLKCGKKGIPIQRNKGHMHGKNHRKKLYCLNCHCEVNHIEIFSASDLEQFRKDFESGVYEHEAEESIRTCGVSSLW